MLNQRTAIAIPNKELRITVTIRFFAVCCHEVGPSAPQVASEVPQDDGNRVEAMRGTGD